MKNKIYPSIAIILLIILVLNPLASTQESQGDFQPQINRQEDQTPLTISEEIPAPIAETDSTDDQFQNQEELSYLEQTEDSNQEILLPLEKIENFESIKSNPTNSSVENIAYTEYEEITIPLEEIINKTENKTNTQILQLTNTTQFPIENKTNNEQFDSLKIETENKNTTTDTIDEKMQTESSQLQEKEIKKINTALISYGNGKKIEIEGKIREDFDINSIEKKESIIDEQSKEVIIKSEEHLEDPLTIYTDIPEIKKDQISNVEVYWVNEKKGVSITGFYDTDNNNLYDRISWVVPHLSEQIFEIRINKLVEVGNESQDIIIQKLPPTPTDGQTINQNYIYFNFSINYTNSSALACNFSMNTTPTFSKKITTTSSWEANLTDFQDGSYSWHINCENEIDNKSAEIQGNFRINENYFVENPDELYVLDWNNNLKGSPNKIIDISSNNAQKIETTLKKDGTIINSPTNTSASSTNYNLEGKLTQPGNYELIVKFYNLVEPTTITKTFSVAKANIQFSDTEIETDEATQITVDIDSPGKNIDVIIIDYGDGGSTTGTITNPKNFHQVFTRSYNSDGDYTISLKFWAVVNSISNMYSFSKGTIHVADQGDTQAPEVTLIGPEDKETINETEITFYYTVNDNIKVQNCTFELFSYINNVGILEHSQVKTTPTHNTKISLPYKDFEEGEYSWGVYCCDNSSNCNSDTKYSRDFTVDFAINSQTQQVTSTNYIQKEEVTNTLELLDNFLNKIDSMNPEETQALEDLELIENLTYYKKRLVQIDQDLGTNVNFISDQNLKADRIQELIEEYRAIRKNTPIDFKIIEQTEFSKNSITKDLKELVEEYSQNKKIEINKGSIDKLAQMNEEIQKDISVSTNAKKIKIEYEDSTEELTLITKNLNIRNSSFSTLIEYIPEKLGETKFITKEVNKLSEEMYEISLDNLEEDKIIYYVKGLINLEKTTESDTLLFENFSIKKSSITGLFFLGDGFNNSIWTYIIFAALISILIYLASWIISKNKMSKWKKEENVRRIVSLSKKAKESLQSNEIQEAKDSYHNIKEIYPLVPEGFKKHAYKEIKRIRVGIDRREILLLVKEYDKAKKENRTTDYKKIYEDVKATYKRLPKKDQEKIYNKMFKDEWDI